MLQQSALVTSLPLRFTLKRVPSASSSSQLRKSQREAYGNRDTIRKLSTQNLCTHWSWLTFDVLEVLFSSISLVQAWR